MKRIFLVFILFLFMFSSAEILRGSTSYDYIPKGFYGSWGVISKLQKTTNPKVFNYESRDIWTLSGYSNILILENLESGARSEITVKEKSIDGKTLHFSREKETKEKGLKVTYIEDITFVLLGRNFSGTDKYTVKRYDENNKLAQTDTAEYRIEGVKISGGEY